MQNYNDNNIKNILELINRPGLATVERMIRLANKKFNINENEVIKSIELLIDLKVIKEKNEMVGDGWNTRETWKVYELAQ
tara:strand:+ start:1712 stop:1951 length:240 start_codon:yes stop_codon:yes gene_type:complete